MQGERAHAGLYAYAVADDLAAVARKQAAAMATRGELFHNPSLASDVTGWQEVAENVGRGTDVDTVDQAFQGSSVHRDHVLSTDLRQVGVGVATGSDGQIYVSEVFRLPAGSAPSVTVAAPASTRSTPRVRTVRLAVPVSAAPSPPPPVVTAEPSFVPVHPNQAMDPDIYPAYVPGFIRAVAVGMPVKVAASLLVVVLGLQVAVFRRRGLI